MPVFCTVRFLDTGKEIEWFGGRGYYYELKDGVAITLHPEMAWCSECDEFVDAELIESIQNMRTSWQIFWTLMESGVERSEIV